VRVVLWTNEENGLRGGQAYRDWVGEKVGNHVAAIEMDGGAEKPVGFGFGPGGARGGPRPAGGGGGSGEAPGTQSSAAADGAFEKVQQIGQLLAAIEAGEITRGGGGADIGPLVRDGVPGFSLRTVGEHYFDWHHSHADTLDKVNRDDFRRSVAALAVMAYVLAEMPERLNVR
jgi:Zn-dependent M28 family amino/carboxypeptidase